MAAAEEVDVVVLGMGPGGESVAGELAAAGLSVVGWKPGSWVANAPTTAACRPK